MGEAQDITHAIVRFIQKKNDPISIIEVSNIKEFRNDTPVDCFDFIQKQVYYGRIAAKSPYSPVTIFALGCENDLKEKLLNENTANFRRFKSCKFNTSDYESMVNSSIEDSAQPGNSKTVTNSSDDTDYDKTTDDGSSDPESVVDETAQCKKKVEEINKKQQQATLASKIKILSETNNLQSHDISQITKVSDNTSISSRMEKLEEENKRLKERLRCKEKMETQTNFGKAKRELKFNDEENLIDGDEDIDDVPLCCKERPKKNISKYSHYNLSPPKKYRTREENFEKFEKWLRTVNDKEVEMIHLGNGFSIELNKWREAKRAKTVSIFVKNIARTLWGTKKLANRFLKANDRLTQLENMDSPRKVVTPQKLTLIEDCLKFFLIKIKPSLIKTDVESELCQVRSILSEEMAYQQRQYKKSVQEDAS